MLKKLRVSDQDNSESEDEDFDAGQLKISRIGSLLRQSQEKVSHLKVRISKEMYNIFKFVVFQLSYYPGWLELSSIVMPL